MLMPMERLRGYSNMFIDKTVHDFVNLTASNAPTPGGGGVSALVGALGIALGNMVGELTIGKKKYADVEDDIKRLMQEAQELKEEFLRLIDADAEAFAPLAKAYGIPKDDPGRDEIMEEALKTAASVPMDIVHTCGKALRVIEEFAEKGSKIAISDAGCAAALCGAAMQASALNVYINTQSMKDRIFAESMNSELDRLLNEYVNKGDVIYNRIASSLR